MHRIYIELEYFLLKECGLRLLSDFLVKEAQAQAIQALKHSHSLLLAN